MATLTIGGKVPMRDDTRQLATFRKLVALMLAIARQDAKLCALADKQDAWLAAHEDHELYTQRVDAHRALNFRLTHLHTDLHIARCNVSNALIDLLPATIAELSAAYGSPVTVATPQQWVLAAFYNPDASDDDVLAGKVAPY